MPMIKFALLGLILFMIRASYEWQLTKCCPPGQIFVNNFFKCKSLPIFAIKVYSHYWNITRELQGIPQCDEFEDLVTTPLVHFESIANLEKPACLETFYDQEEEPIIIIRHCQSNKDLQVKAIDTSFWQLLHIRKCCFDDTIFDSGTKACVTGLNESQSLGAFLLNRSTDTESAMILTQGPPKCEGPIVNYEINENDISLRNGTYLVKVPAFNNIVKEEPITEDNACLEMTPDFALKRRLAVRICREPEFCDKNACIRKCCPEDEYLYLDKYDYKNKNLYLYNYNYENESLYLDKYDYKNKNLYFYNYDYENESLYLDKYDYKNKNLYLDNYDYEYESLYLDKYDYYRCVKRLVPNDPGEFYNAFANAVSQMKSVTFDTTKDYGVLIQLPCQEIHRFFDPIEWEEHVLLESNGHVFLYSDTDGMHCFDVVHDKFNNSFLFVLIYCETVTYNIDRPAWILTLIVVKCVFLLMTLLVYAFLPNLQNIHGKMVICYVSNVLLSNILTFIIISFNEVLLEQQRRIECIFLFYIGFFSGQANGFWLNVMCFDMWRSITTFENRTNCNNRKRFLLCCLYGWGIPLLLSILIIVAVNTDFLPKYLIPNIGNIACGLTLEDSWDNYSELIFDFGPQTILLISNVVFFILTTKYYTNVKANIKSRTDPRSKQLHSSRKRFIMIFKLFIVMGMRLIINAVQYYLFKSSSSYPDWNVFFNITFVLNISDGILIFIILVLKKNVYQAIRKRLQDIRKNQPAT